VIDPDAYIRMNFRGNKDAYYELLLVYVDAVLHKPERIMEALGKTYEHKEGLVKPLKLYLGSNIEKFQLPDGRDHFE
jgi:hypothetical protein